MPWYPRHRPVVVVVHHEHRGADLVGIEQRRVVQVLGGGFPERAADATLRPFVLEHPAHAGLPADAAVGARHVADRGARLGRGEEVGLRDHVGDLVAAPGMTLDADPVAVHVPLAQDAEHPRHDRIQGALAGVADLVGNIGDEHYVAATDVEGNRHG